MSKAAVDAVTSVHQPGRPGSPGTLTLRYARGTPLGLVAHKRGSTVSWA
ncbi:hypothetical protein KXD96_15800 [Mycobacterium sp. SMC-2]|nr:hypothetical protein [Mycobacterium sp. SMC-2]UXA04481.1 hypothetical protein KXD96_15800 [Mycobacterium sp. SMC-2]